MADTNKKYIGIMKAFVIPELVFSIVNQILYGIWHYNSSDEFLQRGFFDLLLFSLFSGEQKLLLISFVSKILFMVFIFKFCEKSASHPLLIAVYGISIAVGLYNIYLDITSLAYGVLDNSAGYAEHIIISNVTDVISGIISVAVSCYIVFVICNKFKYVQMVRYIKTAMLVSEAIGILYSLADAYYYRSDVLLIGITAATVATTICSQTVQMVFWFRVAKDERQVILLHPEK